MLPKFVCNLATTISRPPWRSGLDWDLHTTRTWEKRVPFHLLIRPSPPVHCGQKQPNLSRFYALPAELQVHILTFCSADTLFQLMRVSSSLRVEASKLFWADPTRYFLVEADWLLEEGNHGFICYDLGFLEHVQQVQIEYSIWACDTIFVPEDIEETQVRQDLIKTFWGCFTQRFPNAKRVVINQSWDTPFLWQDTFPVAPSVRLSISSCPPGLQVSALVLEKPSFPVNMNWRSESERWCRSLYQITEDGGWVGTRSDTHPTTVLMPTKRLDGSIGGPKAIEYKSHRVLLKECALWPLMIEAIDRHHFDLGKNNPFFCPFPSCSAHFAKAGEWTTHAIFEHAQMWRVGNPMDILPDSLRVAFIAKADALKKEKKEIDKQYRILVSERNKQGKERQEEREGGWIFPREVDETGGTEKEAGESGRWSRCGMI